MNPSLLLFPILVPLLFWAAYHYYHDRHRPEPIANLLFCIALGVGSAYLSQYFYQALDVIGLRYDAFELADNNLPGLFLYAVLGIGFTEELAKMLPYLFIALRFRAFDEPLDGIIYSSFIALGFALVENLLYLEFLTTQEALARGFAGPLVHIVFASVWAYHMGVAHLAGHGLIRATLIWMGAAALLHGVYDFVVIGLSQWALIAAAIGIVTVWLWRLKLIRRLSLPR